MPSRKFNMSPWEMTSLHFPSFAGHRGGTDVMGVFTVTVDLKSGYRGGPCLGKPYVCLPPKSGFPDTSLHCFFSREALRFTEPSLVMLHSTQLSLVPTFTCAGDLGSGVPGVKVGGGWQPYHQKLRCMVGAKEGTHVPTLAH